MHTGDQDEAGRPLMVCLHGEDRFVEEDGKLAKVIRRPVVITGDIIARTVELISKIHFIHTWKNCAADSLRWMAGTGSV